MMWGGFGWLARESIPFDLRVAPLQRNRPTKIDFAQFQWLAKLILTISTMKWICGLQLYSTI
jgi:hypothetical protein